MVVSQWGLVSKNSGCKTSPGHPMVVSQWSNPEQQPTQLAARLLKPDPKFPTPRRTTVPSPATYPSITWAAVSRALLVSQGGSLRVASATDSEGKDYQKERPARALWWSASGNLTQERMQDQPRAPWWSAKWSNPKHTNCGSIILWGARRALLEIYGCRHPILVPKLAPFRTFGNCIERTNTHNTETHDTGQPTTARTDGPTKKHAKSPTELTKECCVCWFSQCSFQKCEMEQVWGPELGVPATMNF